MSEFPTPTASTRAPEPAPVLVELAGLVESLRAEAAATLAEAIRLERSDGLDMRPEARAWLARLDRCAAELEAFVASAGDCGADPGECVCRCHLR